MSEKLAAEVRAFLEPLPLNKLWHGPATVNVFRSLPPKLAFHIYCSTIKMLDIRLSLLHF